MKKTFLSLITAAVLTLALCACSPQDASNPPAQGGVVQSPPASLPTASALAATAAPSATNHSAAVYDDEDKHAIKDNLKSLGDTVEYHGIEYTVTAAQFTKEPGDADPNEINFFDNDQRDEDGRLLGSKSYVFISMTIQNTTDEKLEELVNRPMVTVSADHKILETGAECRGIVNPQEGQSRQNAHHFILEPGQSADIQAIYIIDDEFITEDLYFLIGVAGGNADSAENKFIRIANEG